MNNICFRIALLLTMFAYVANAYSYDFEVNGLCYNKLSANSVEVTFKVKVGNSYSGKIDIPEKVYYNGVTYSVTSIGERAFYQCSSLTGSLTIPNSVTFIGEYAFNTCSGFTGSLTIPNSVTFIGDAAFTNCTGLSGSLTIPNTITSISKYCFAACWGLTGLSIPNSVTMIEEAAFSGCHNLTGSLSIPYSVVSIGERAFQDCWGLTGITIPNSVTSIGSSAFANCRSLDIVKTEIEKPYSIDTYVFWLSNSKHKTLKVPKGTKSKYTAFTGWTTYFNEIIEEASITTYTLSVTVSGKGSTTYEGIEVRNKTQSFAVNEGASALLSFTPDTGYRIASVKLNNVDVTSSVTNNRYTISKITANTTLNVTFEAIPSTIYTLSIKAMGNGSVVYNESSIRENTTSFTVNRGSTATVSFVPDEGYRLKSVKLNNSDVTSSVYNNIYSIYSIAADLSLEVEFEANPTTTYTLVIAASGNGSVSYGTTTIRNQTESFTVVEGTSTTFAFNPDSGYRIASIKLNDADVTLAVSNNQYTINKVTANTTLVVTFEAIPSATYTFTIKATGNGTATYNGTTIRGKSSSFTVNEGASATITFTPDNGYRIKSVKLNNTDVTSSVSNGKYTISNITNNTTLEVEFEIVTYTLSIKAIGNGKAIFNNTSIRGTSTSFSVNRGSTATLSFTPDEGYQLKSVKLNNSDVTSSVYNNTYSIYSIAADLSLEIVFEAIPVPTYTLTIIAVGNGNATYNDIIIRDQSRQFTVNEGSKVIVAFNPDNGNTLGTVITNGVDITSDVSGNRYVIDKMTVNTTIEVTFVENVYALTVEGINYTVVSQSNKTVMVAGGNYGQVLTVPATVTQSGATWAVTAVDDNALKDNTELAAVIWNPAVPFTATVSNPNLLLYVTSEQYAPASIKNVVVNGVANNITLVGAASGNGFYCPQAFTAQSIIYTHNYSMSTGIGESRGWETLALPFDVQSIRHESKGEIVPFVQKKEGDGAKPFWLYELTGTGFVKAGSIKAYTPYIISMPHHQQYDEQWHLNGRVTFSASNVTIAKTEDLQTPSYMDRTFVPCFMDKDANEGLYSLNVNNDYSTNNSGVTEGSKFVLNMRPLHPFEAYMITSSNAKYMIDIFEDMPNAINEMECDGSIGDSSVYDLQGRKTLATKKGVYIKNGRKYIK